MWLIHYTDRRNLQAIRETRMLKSALLLMNETEKKYYARKKRGESLPLKNGAVLRDQQPLSDRIVFCGGTNLSEYIEYLNTHVFFWPASSAGKQYRKNFREKYPHPEHIGLRCKLDDLREANPDAEILFSKYNSGATPRCNPAKSPRCLRLFRPLEKRRGEKLVEIVVQNENILPHNTEKECAAEKWRRLF